MDNKKIGLCMAMFHGTNYGMLLQAFATQQMVEKLGYDTEIIHYQSGANKGIAPSLGAAYVAMKAVSSHVKSKLFRKPDELDDEHRKNLEDRLNLADQFRKTKMHNIVFRNGIDELRESSKGYHAVLVGSDQIWLPDVAFTNFFTLRFAAEGVQRISYATSLGVSSYPKYCRKAAAEYWKQIDCLSVREEQGKEIIQSIVDVPVCVVVDPTYLFTKKEWEDLIPPKRILEERYVFCYFLSDDHNAKKCAQDYARKHGYKCVGIMSSESNAKDEEYDEVLCHQSPEDFVNLIRYAECVFTDSFHGLAFSVIHEKDFYVFYRKRKDAKASRNSRIDHVLKMWGLENRLLMPEQDADEEGIDYGVVNPRIERKREASLAFLQDALKG